MFYVLTAMLVLTFMLKGVPFFIEFYDSQLSGIDLLLEKQKRLNNILIKSDYWQQEYSKIKSAEEKKMKRLFTAKSKELVAAKLQALLKQLARNSGTKIESSLLPEFKKNEQWLIVSQNISINGGSGDFVKFIKMIEQNQKKLIITHLKLRSRRRQLSGSFTVVGFSRIMNKADIK